MIKKLIKPDPRPNNCQECGKPMPLGWYCFIDKWICKECFDKI